MKIPPTVFIFVRIWANLNGLGRRLGAVETDDVVRHVKQE
jgi:hypothetical protein